MITVDDFYNFINYLARKDSFGNVITEDNLNLLMPVVANKYLESLLERMGKDKKNIRELDPVTVANENITADAEGQCLKTTLAQTYKELYSGKFDDGTVVIPIVDLNSADFDDWDSSNIIKPDNQPFMTVRNTYFEFRPKDIGADAHVTYIREPSTPYRAYAIDYDTAESVYLTMAGYIIITGKGTAGNTVTVLADAVTLGSYTVISGDTVSDIMKALTASINSNKEVTGCRAVYDESKLWVNIDTGTYATLSTTIVGSVTRSLTNFASRSTQFDWANDDNSMMKIVEIFTSMSGLSTRENMMIQWSEMQQQKNNK